MFEAVADPMLGEIDAEEHMALRALSAAYLADDLRVRGQRLNADSYLQRALELVPSDHWDIRSRIHLVRALCATAEHDLWAASEELECAQKMVSSADLPARDAEIRLQRARIFMRERLFYVATALLEPALAFAPKDRDQRLTLEIVHDRLQVALIQRDLDRAASLLGRAKELEDHVLCDPDLPIERRRFAAQLAIERSLPNASSRLDASLGAVSTRGLYQP